MGYYLLEHPQRLAQYRRTRRNRATATGTIILHDAEGGTDLSGADTGAENVAKYITTRDSYGSYHRLVDRDTAIKMAPIDAEVFHCVPSNNWSVGICVAWTKADLPRMTYDQRRAYYVPFARAVLDVRAEFAERGIHVPIDRYLTRAEVMARKPGISTHSRTDPSRRSDPFGTGSAYEREFLAVLHELATTNPTTQEDDDMATAQEIADAVEARLRRAQWLTKPDGKPETIEGALRGLRLGGANIENKLNTVRASAGRLEAAFVGLKTGTVDVAALAAVLRDELGDDLLDDLAERLRA